MSRLNFKFYTIITRSAKEDKRIAAFLRPGSKVTFGQLFDHLLQWDEYNDVYPSSTDQIPWARDEHHMLLDNDYYISWSETRQTISLHRRLN